MSVNSTMTLTSVATQQFYRVTALPKDLEKEARLIDIGIFIDCQLKLISISPFNGPVAIAIHGSAFSLPAALAADIKVEAI